MNKECITYLSLCAWTFLCVYVGYALTGVVFS